MLNKVRKLLRERSPNWLNAEVNKELVQNLFTATTPTTIASSTTIPETPSSRIETLTSPGNQETKKSLELTFLSHPKAFQPLCTEFFTPGTPHWRRIRQVFQALDTAPENATYSQLIEYVRETTGKGCSRKLISKWKKQRQLIAQFNTANSAIDSTDELKKYADNEAGTLVTESSDSEADNYRNNQATNTQNSSWWSYATATVMVAGLVGCDLLPTQLEGINPQKDTAVASVEPQGIPGAVPPVKRRSQKLEPRTIKISLTLSNPQDLKVKPGEEVNVGEVLSDRTSERDRLMAKKQQLELSLKKLDVALTAPIPPKPVPQMSELPPVSYAEEEAKIKLKSQNLKEAEAAVANQQQKIEQLQNLLEAAADERAREPINLIIEHERAKLENLQAAVAEAQIQLQMSQAQLATAKEKRAYAEHQQQLEKNRRVMATEQQRLEVQQQEQQRQRQLQTMEYNKAQLRAQIQEVENAVAQLGQVKSPYPGVVKKIKWVGQSDNVLTAELTLAVTSTESAITKPNTTG